MPQNPGLGLHPALQSFIAGYTTMKDRQIADEERKIRHQNEDKRFNEGVRQFDEEAKHRSEILKINQQNQLLNEKMKNLQARQVISQLIGRGQIKPTGNSGSDSQVSNMGQLPQPDQYELDGQTFNANEFGTPQEQGEAALDLQKPGLDYKADINAQLADQQAAARMQQVLAQAKERLLQEQNRQKFTGEQNELNRTNQRTIAETREKGANSRNAASTNAAIQAANIRAATSKEKEVNKPKTALQLKEEEKQTANDTFDKNIANLFSLGEKTKWNQQGKFGETMGKARDGGYLNPGSDDEVNYRSFSGKVFGKQAFGEAGKSMTKNELAIIKKFATDLSIDPKAAKTRINSLLHERGIIVAPDGRIIKKNADGTGRLLGTVGEQ